MRIVYTVCRMKRVTFLRRDQETMDTGGFFLAYLEPTTPLASIMRFYQFNLPSKEFTVEMKF